MDNDLKKIDNLLPDSRDPTLIDELQFELDRSKSFEDQAKDIAMAIATEDAIKDKELIDDLTTSKKRELSEAARKSLKQEQAKGKDADKAYQKSLFGIYDGIAEYMGLRKDLPGGLIKVIMWVMQPILGLVMLIVGLIAGTINIVMDAVNAIVERFAKLADGAKRIILTLFYCSIAALIVIALYKLLERFGIVLF